MAETTTIRQSGSGLTGKDLPQDPGLQREGLGAVRIMHMEDLRTEILAFRFSKSAYSIKMVEENSFAVSKLALGRQ